MELDKIEKLIEKYFEATTSVAEEEKLKEYFSFRKYLGNSSSYIKTSGNAFNGIKNGNLNDDDLSKMISLYNQYKKQKKNLFQIDDFDNLDHFVQYIRERAFKEIGNDIRYLASIAVVVCYAEHPSQSNEFAWKCFGDGIIQNIINNKFTKGLFGEKSIFLPVKDNRGTISYLWDNYKLKERDLNEIK